MQQTLILLKPDAVQRRLVGEVMARFERKGLRLVGLKLVKPTREPGREALRGPQGQAVLREPALVPHQRPDGGDGLGGPRGGGRVPRLMGLTDGAKSPPGTIRGDFGLSVQNNLVHG